MALLARLNIVDLVDRPRWHYLFFDVDDDNPTTFARGFMCMSCLPGNWKTVQKGALGAGMDRKKNCSSMQSRYSRTKRDRIAEYPAKQRALG